MSALKNVKNVVILLFVRKLLGNFIKQFFMLDFRIFLSFSDFDFQIHFLISSNLDFFTSSALVYFSFLSSSLFTHFWLNASLSNPHSLLFLKSFILDFNALHRDKPTHVLIAMYVYVRLFHLHTVDFHENWILFVLFIGPIRISFMVHDKRF